MLDQLLVKIGLTHKEAIVYLSCFSLGTQCASVISQKCGLKRTSTHLILKRLLSSGFVGIHIQKKTQFFTAVPPEKLLIMFKERENMMKKNHREFECVLEDFQKLVSPYSTQPKVRFFSGIDGIKTVMEDTLNSSTGILCYSILDGWFTHDALKKYAFEYAYKRVKKNKIHLRAIDADTLAARHYLSAEYPRNKKLTESRWLPKDIVPFTNEVNIYGNKLAIVSLDPREYFGIIVESESIAQMQRSIFELAWRHAEPECPPPSPNPANAVRLFGL